jgi:hypothetical protein
MFVVSSPIREEGLLASAATIADITQNKLVGVAPELGSEGLSLELLGLSDSLWVTRSQSPQHLQRAFIHARNQALASVFFQERFSRWRQTLVFAAPFFS